MLISIVDRHKVVHVAWGANHTPYLYSMFEKESQVWCFCAQYALGFAMRFVDPPTCLECIVAIADRYSKWHYMVQDADPGT